MSVALSDVRFQIQDQPRSFGVAPESPRALGQADGATTTFYLPLDGRQLIAGTAQLYETPIGGVPVGVAAPSYAVTQQGVVTFSVAPGAGGSPAIAAGSVIGAAFQAVVFADTDLANVLAQNVARYGSDDLVKWGCQLDIINVLLANVEKLARIREAEYERDPNAVISALVKLKAELRKDIEGAARPGRATPALVFGQFYTGRPYQPIR